MWTILHLFWPHCQIAHRLLCLLFLCGPSVFSWLRAVCSQGISLHLLRCEVSHQTRGSGFHWTFGPSFPSPCFPWVLLYFSPGHLSLVLSPKLWQLFHSPCFRPEERRVGKE